MYKRQAVQDDYSILLDIWSKSITETHDFLKEEDFDEISKIMPKYFDLLDIIIWYDGEKLIGFSAVSGTHLEMLFLDPIYHKKGYGKQIITFLIDDGILTVNVNEKNKGAYIFYKKQGFDVIGRNQTDEMERGYSVICMKFKKC